MGEGGLTSLKIQSIVISDCFSLAENTVFIKVLAFKKENRCRSDDLTAVVNKQQ